MIHQASGPSLNHVARNNNTPVAYPRPSYNIRVSPRWNSRVHTRCVHAFGSRRSFTHAGFIRGPVTPKVCSATRSTQPGLPAGLFIRREGVVDAEARRGSVQRGPIQIPRDNLRDRICSSRGIIYFHGDEESSKDGESFLLEAVSTKSLALRATRVYKYRRRGL